MISSKDKRRYSRSFKKAEDALKNCVSIPGYENREITISVKIFKSARKDRARPQRIIIKGAHFENPVPVAPDNENMMYHTSV